ncbi:MAG: DUF1552 domain-containing protein [Pseudomonadota bacterium]
MTNLNRRIFLRGLGGAVVAAPFLSSLFERFAKAKSMTPTRTIVMYTQYGCITNKWFPLKLAGELSAEDLLPTSLAPLAPFAKKLLMPRGIRSMNEWSAHNTGAGHGLGQGNDWHTQVLGSALTCQPVTPNENDPFSFNSSTKFDAMPMGASLDHVLAQQRSTSGLPLYMNTAGQVKEGPNTAVSYSAAQTRFPPVTAADAFDSLTGLFSPRAPINADTWAVAKGKAIADIVRADLTRLRNRDMSKEDKYKLGAWIELTNQIGKIIASEQCSQDLAKTLGASNPLGTGDGDALTRKVSDTMDNADLYSAVAALTAACNANPVIVLKYPADFTFTGLGINTSSDNLAKRVGSANMVGTCLADAVSNLLKIDAYHAQKFANLVRMLDDISEDGGTVLDNTVTIWLNEDSDGCAHNLNNLPIIQAGSGGGYFKTGKIIHLDADSGATPEDMLGRSLAFCSDGTTQLADGLSKATGTDPRFGNAPINKYYCNIMNAMGLKADATGYPAADGSNSEVTHFGYSDKTEDFCGGLAAVPGATIHQPGAFDELKA